MTQSSRGHELRNLQILFRDMFDFQFSKIETYDTYSILRKIGPKLAYSPTGRSSLRIPAKNYRMRVNVVNPGPTRTGLRAAAFPGEDPNELPPPEHVSETMIRLAQPGFRETGLWIAADAELTASPDKGSLH